MQRPNRFSYCVLGLLSLVALPVQGACAIRLQGHPPLLRGGRWKCP